MPSPSRPRVVLLCCDGPFQRYLAQRLADSFALAGIVIHAPHQPRGSLAARARRLANPLALLAHLRARAAMRRSHVRAEPLLRQLFARDDETLGEWPPLPVIHVPDINDARAAEFVGEHSPDVVCVNGTNLLRQAMLALLPRIPLGIVNLHTGLSPYSRGGNCNLFMLLESRPELVGVTVHHIDAGIDSGDIIYTGRPELQSGDNYEMIEARSWKLGIDLMIRAVEALSRGAAPRVKQWTEGKLFLRRTGYVYSPLHWARVDRLLRDGLLERYLGERSARDAGIRVVGDAG